MIYRRTTYSYFINMSLEYSTSARPLIFPANDNRQPQITLTDLFRYWGKNRLDFAFYRERLTPSRFL